MAAEVPAATHSGNAETAHVNRAKTAILPDPAYEFSAPKFYNFATNSGDLPVTERADAWFDTAATSSRGCTAYERSCSMLC